MEINRLVSRYDQGGVAPLRIGFLAKYLRRTFGQEGNASERQVKSFNELEEARQWLIKAKSDTVTS